MADTGLMEKSESTDLLEIDRDLFREKFNRGPFVIRHRLVDHPLFDVGRLIRLSQDLPEDRVEYSSGELDIDQDHKLTPRTGLSVEETIRRIGECKSWMVLKNVERDPEYGELLRRTLASVRPLSGEMLFVEGFVFLSSPGSVTPYHIDPEHNFLLQIRGTKQVHMFDPRDRELVSEEALETFHRGGAHRNMKFEDRFHDRAEVIDLHPGDGVHFPVTAPHWVQNGPEVSISFSVTWRSHWSERNEILYKINAGLRRMGLKPRPVGGSQLIDNGKFLAFRTLRGVKNLFRRTG